MTAGSRKYLLTVLLCMTAAGALWCFGFFQPYFHPKTPASPAGTAPEQKAVTVRGTFFRTSVPVECGGARAEFLLSDGEKVGKNDLLGYRYATQSERRAALLACAAQGDGATPARGSGTADAVRAYALALSREDCAGALWEASALHALTGSRSLSFPGNGATACLIRSRSAGIFVSGATVWLDSGSLPATPEEARALSSLPPKDGAGSIITRSRWYFAALTTEKDCRALTAGNSCLLYFEGCAEPREAVLLSLTDGEDGTVLAVFSSTERPREELHYHSCAAVIPIESAPDDP